MYRNSYQRGMLSIFFSGGANPLNLWDTQVKDGVISRFLDPDIRAMVLEIKGTNVSTTYMTCPKGKIVLGISMPFMVMIVKNLKKYFTFEVTILDETGTRRRFRVANFQSQTQIQPLCTVMPIGLSEGWNQIQFNLADFTRRAYQKQFVEVQKVKINANIRLRRIYFAERLLPEEELPAEYKLFFPLSAKGKGKQAAKVEEEKKDLEAVVPRPPSEALPPEQTLSSKVEIEKLPSKASLQSVKKISSQEEKKDSKEQMVELKEQTEEVTEAEARTSATKTSDEPLEGIPENQDEIVEEGAVSTTTKSQMEGATIEGEVHGDEDQSVPQEQVKESAPEGAAEPEVPTEPETVPEAGVEPEAPAESETPAPAEATE